MARPERRKGGMKGAPSTNTSSGGGGGAALRMIIRALGIVMVVVAVGILSSSGPLQSCLVDSVAAHAITAQTESSSSGPPEQPLMWDSTNATVMGYATGYAVPTYKKFVGSLRNSGFKGHIILAIAPDADEKVTNYLASRNVIMHKVKFIECTYELMKEEEETSPHDRETRTCMAPYAHLKARWGRFPLLRDYLEECKTCTGPVLVSDVRDTLFQRDPFGSGDPEPKGLQVFQEFVGLRTDNWIVDHIIRMCKGDDDPLLGKRLPMLCSGTTIGTRQAMLDYLDAMHDEMKIWMNTPSCRLQISADDQSIHNYLYYNGKFKNAESIPNRMGIVHTIGNPGARIHELAMEYQKVHNVSIPEHQQLAPLRMMKSKTQRWMAKEFSMTDDEGFVLDFDGTRSRVVHQYDRLGLFMETWFTQFSGLVDTPLW